MIIKRLTMNNFGVYEGENTFEFSYSLPVVLIGGMNGRGKTTFLEAILLALYGENSKAYKESKYKTYGQYLRSYVNKNSWTQRCYVELDFILNERDSEEYLIRREWNALSKRTSETLSVKQNGKINTFLTKNWQMFVENILPSALSSFYFFDGEKIAELAVDDTDSQMKESIRAMLGITVLDVLKNDLLRSVRRTEKNIQGEDVPAELKECKAEQEMLTAKLTETKKEVEELIELITDQIDKIELLHQEYAVKGGNALEQRQSLIQKRAELTAELEQNNGTLIELASGELPLLLVENLIRDIKLTAEDEHDDLIMQQAFGQLETLLCEYNKLHTEDVSANQEFVDFVKEHTFESQTTPVYKLSDHALFQANSLAEDLLSLKKKQTIDVLERKHILKHQLDEVDSYLSLDINEKELNAKLAEIKKQEKVLVEMQVKKTSLDQKRAELESKLAIKTSEYNRIVERYLAAAELTDDAKRQLKYSSIALQIIDKFSVELQKRKTGALGETITDCYKKLANKKNLISQIKVDPQSLSLSYIDKQGILVAKESLSAGEKQLMVIAILWALAICSAKKLPVIIDTPLSRLDSMHRKSLVTTYFPKASDQTIILSTDSEIDRYYYGLMKDYVGDEFTLEYNEETQSSYKYNTTIKDDVVDRDVAVMIPLSTSENSDPRKVKGYLRDSINISSRSVSIKEPCVRASYFENGEEWLHIDLPLYAEDSSNVYLARGKEYSSDYSWELADPDGLNDYLCGKINGNDQLRRIVCFIKRWRNEKYSGSTNDHEVPPSIGLTLLACDCFSAQSTSEGADDLLSLQKTMKAILDQFTYTYDGNWNRIWSIKRNLPVTPYTDVFKKMKESSSSYMTTFHDRLSNAVDSLTNAVNVESAHDAAEYVQKVLGDRFTVPPKEAVVAAAQNKREHSFG